MSNPQPRNLPTLPKRKKKSSESRDKTTKTNSDKNSSSTANGGQEDVQQQRSQDSQTKIVKKQETKKPETKIVNRTNQTKDNPKKDGQLKKNQEPAKVSEHFQKIEDNRPEVVAKLKAGEPTPKIAAWLEMSGRTLQRYISQDNQLKEARQASKFSVQFQTKRPEITKKLKEGETLDAIAGWLEIPASTLQRHIDGDAKLKKIKDRNVRPQKIKFQDNYQEISSRLESGEPMTDIAKWLGMPKSTLKRHVDADDKLKKIKKANRSSRHYRQFQANRYKIIIGFETGESMREMSQWLKMSASTFKGYVSQDKELKQIKDKAIYPHRTKIQTKSRQGH